ELVRVPRRPAGHHELPDPEVLEIDRIPDAVLFEGAPHVDLIIHAVRLLLLEVVRIHRLGRLLLEVDIGGERVTEPRYALLEAPSLDVDDPEAGIERRAIGVDPGAHRGSERLEMAEQRLDLLAEAGGHADLVA